MRDRRSEEERLTYINRRVLKGKSLKAVEAGLIEAYSKLYPDYKIEIDTREEPEYNYTYPDKGVAVYIKNFKVLNSDNQIIEQNIRINFYPNLEVIKFAKGMTEEEIQAESNDYSYDNHTELEERLKALATMYVMQGSITVKRIEVYDGGLTFECYKNDNKNNDLWLHKQFDLQPISKSIAETHFKDIKKKLENYLK